MTANETLYRTTEGDIKEQSATHRLIVSGGVCVLVVDEVKSK